MQSRIGRRTFGGALAITMASVTSAAFPIAPASLLSPASLVSPASLTALVALVPGCQNRAPEPAGAKPASQSAAPGSAAPEGHPSNPTPAAGGAASPAGRQAITWTVPGSWQTVPNPNTMRLATYTVGEASGEGPVEVSVSRAGGSTAANIERWQGQFTDSQIARRAQETVHGLTVTVVEIDGTYSPGAMGAGDNTPHPHWGLSAAIVETPAGSYFFKMLGPKAKVANGTSAHDSFEALVNSIAPS